MSSNLQYYSINLMYNKIDSQTFYTILYYKYNAKFKPSSISLAFPTKEEGLRYLPPLKLNILLQKILYSINSYSNFVGSMILKRVFNPIGKIV